MNKNEFYKEIEKQFSEDENKITVPQSLEPAAVAEMLKKDQKKRRGGYKKWIAAAASLAVLVGSVGVYRFSTDPNRQQNTQDHASAGEAHVSGTETVGDGGVKLSFKKKDSIGSYKLAAGYDEIYAYIDRRSEQYNSYEKDSASSSGAGTGSSPDQNKLDLSSSAENFSQNDAASKGEAPEEIDELDYSKTNTIEEAVDEADIVKTDGKYLYLCKYETVKIVDITGKKMQKLSEIRPDMSTGKKDRSTIREIYLDNGKLVIIYTTETIDESVYNNGGKDIVFAENAHIDVAYFSGDSKTIAETYDVSDVTKPKRIGKVEQEGVYHTSRKVDDYVYLFTQFNPYEFRYKGVIDDSGADQQKESSDQEEKELKIPKINGKKIDADHFYLPKDKKNAVGNTLVVSSIDLKDASGTADEMAIMNDYAQVYMAQKAIYLYQSEWRQSPWAIFGANDENLCTTVSKFSYDEGKLDAVASATFEGEITEVFGLSEKNDHLRVLATARTSDWEPTNVLYTFDDQLKQLGKIDGIAPGEDIYAARYTGEMAYFVTYRNMDPLFAVDLSDEKNPKMLGFLEITGYSEYLHPFGDGKMLGIGYETDPETTARTGVKISMFDVSNPEHIKVLDSVIIKESTFTQAAYNYKQVLADAEKGIVGFSYETEGAVSEQEYDYYEKYVLYHWNGKKFEAVLEQKLGANGYDTRSLYAQGVLYVINRSMGAVETAERPDITWQIRSFDMDNSYKKIDQLVLK